MTDKLAARMAASNNYVAQLEAERDGLRAEVARMKAEAQAPSVPDDVAKDAARYRWLRWQGCTFYTDDGPVEINGDQKATKHHVCEWAMDDAIDAAILSEAADPEVKP